MKLATISLKPKEMFSLTYEVIDKARALQYQSPGSSWKLQSQCEFQYAHSRFDFKKKLRDWRYPNYTETKVFLMTQPVSNYAGRYNTIQYKL